MKKLYYLLIILLSQSIFAQIPTNYYSTATGTGYTLKTHLYNIIKNASDTGYNWNTVNSCDLDKYYEKDNSILDIYSENPTGQDPYNFVVATNQCGQYVNEGGCYNREHVFPQGFFNGVSPMRSDYHHIVATDGKVNNWRDNYPFGEVSSATVTMKNGAKLGPSSFPGYGGTVFEPINEFKGDIARMLLYFVTRYETQLSGFNSTDPSLNGVENPLDGTSTRGYDQWYINLLLKWHLQDPVSQKEIDRNNCVYSKQNNRNPYIDHPEYVTMIWTSTLETSEVSGIQKELKIVPNPVKNQELTISGLEKSTATDVQIYSMNGQLVQTIDDVKDKQKLILKKLPKGIYILKAGKQTAKIIVE